MPKPREAALEYALAIVEEIEEGKKEIIDGVKEIRYNSIDSYDFFGETEKYCYDSIGFEKVYGLFVNYEDLSDAEYRWQKNKTNDQLMNEVKNDLFEEIIKWKKILNSA